MKLERYELKAEKSLMVFEFVSAGPKGEINDSVASNNNDSDKVLATVVATVYAFTDKYPDAWIYATGSTRSGTRLYRMGVTRYLVDIKADFELYGQKAGEWEMFQRGVEYEAFLAYRKND